jgi:Ion channel
MADIEKAHSKPQRVRRRRTQSFWASDWSLSVLLWLLIGNIFALPLAHYEPWGRLAGRAVLSLIIVSGLIATARNRLLIVITTIFSFSFLLIGWEGVRRPTLYLDLVNDVGAVLFLAFFVYLILRQVLRAGPITARRIEGAIAVYLLTGLIWAFAYDWLEQMRPGSFALPAHASGAPLSELGYFSFTTLTTVGFGDIVPLNPLARSLAVTEALIGQLFPVILIARLVAMELEYHRRPDQ